MTSIFPFLGRWWWDTDYGQDPTVTKPHHIYSHILHRPSWALMGKGLAYIQVHLGPRQSPAQVVMEWEIQTTHRMAVDFQAWMDVSKRYMVINLFFNVILKINSINPTNILAFLYFRSRVPSQSSVSYKRFYKPVTPSKTLQWLSTATIKLHQPPELLR